MHEEYFVGMQFSAFGSKDNLESSDCLIELTQKHLDQTLNATNQAAEEDIQAVKPWNKLSPDLSNGLAV
jgi:hypothetical protein